MSTTLNSSQNYYLKDTVDRLNERKNDIESILDLIKKYENDTINTQTQDTSLLKHVSIEQISIIKSFALLMIYTMVESVWKSSLSSIEEYIRQSNPIPKNLGPGIRQSHIEYLKNIPNNNVPKLFENDVAGFWESTLNNFNFSDKNKGTNLTEKLINKKLCQMGGRKIKRHEIRRGERNTNFQTKIEKMKDDRNKLSHGEISFSMRGRNITNNQLNEFFEYTEKYLESLIKEIDRCISNNIFILKNNE